MQCAQIQFGSPTAKDKAAPHLFFLVDTTADCRKDAIFYSSAILRILLYFHIHVNPELTWGYEIVTDSKASTDRAREVLDLCCSAMSQFHAAINSSLDAVRQPGSSRVKSVSSLFKNVRHLLVQVPWQTSAGNPFQSPLKKNSIKLKTARGSIKTRSYLFVLAGLPLIPEDMGRLASDGSAVASQLLQIKDEFMTPVFWEECINQRLSFSWIDTAEEMDATDQSQFIQSCFGAFLRAFGGSFFSLDELFGHFGSLFGSIDYLRLVHPRSIDPSLARQILSAKKHSQLCASLQKRIVAVGSLNHPALFQGHLAYSTDELHSVVLTPLLPQRTKLASNTVRFDPSSNTIHCIKFLPLDAIKTEMLESECFICVGASTKLEFDGLTARLKSKRVAMLSKIRISYKQSIQNGKPSDVNPFEETAAASGDALSGSESFEERLCVFSYLLPSTLSMRIIHNKFQDAVSSISDSVELPTSAYSMDQIYERTKSWVSNNPPLFLNAFLQKGLWKTENVEDIKTVCFGLWSPETCCFIKSPVPKRQKIEHPEVHAAVDTTDSGIRFSSLESIFSKFRECYYNVVYEKNTFEHFVSKDIPLIYDALVSLDASGDAVMTIVDFYASSVLLPLSTLEERHSGLVDRLMDTFFDDSQSEGALHDKNNVISKEEVVSSRLWIAKVRRKAPRAVDVSDDLRNLVKKESTQLKINETLLQLCIILECLRIGKEIGATLPRVYLLPSQEPKEVAIKRKKRKKVDSEMKPEPDATLLLTQAAYELMERVSIWTVFSEDVFDLPGTGASRAVDTWLFNSFLKPVVNSFYQEQLPEVTKELAIKLGAESNGVESQATIVSPVFKKPKISKFEGSLSKRRLFRPGKDLLKTTIADPAKPQSMRKPALEQLSRRQVEIAKPKVMRRAMSMSALDNRASSRITRDVSSSKTIGLEDFLDPQQKPNVLPKNTNSKQSRDRVVLVPATPAKLHKNQGSPDKNRINHSSTVVLETPRNKLRK